jgi:hypothetical protein
MMTRWVVANQDFSAKPIDWTRQYDMDTISPWADGAIWPNSTQQGQNILVATHFNAPPAMEPGGNSYKSFQGITRDSAGAALAAAKVEGFVTGSDLYVGDVVSDAGGYFQLPTAQGAVNHYLVGYKSGSPDVAGTTVNTLQPT